jgi:hypothetical protein
LSGAIGSKAGEGTASSALSRWINVQLVTTGEPRRRSQEFWLSILADAEKSNGKKSYTVVTPITHDGKTYKPGSKIQLTEEQAAEIGPEVKE